jgi:hypothetical protein
MLECLKPICTPLKKVCEILFSYICEIRNYLQQKLCPLDDLQQKKEDYFYGNETN